MFQKCCEWFRQNFWRTGYRQSHLRCHTPRVSAESSVTFCQISIFPMFLVAILKFCVTCKRKTSAFISETVWDRFLTKFLTPEVIHRLVCQCLPKIVFPPFWAAILKFSVKCKTRLSWKRCKIERFWQNIWSPGSPAVVWNFFPQIIFSPFFPY